MLLLLLALCNLQLAAATPPPTKWGQSRTHIYFTFAIPCDSSLKVSLSSLGDEFSFSCAGYDLQLSLRGSCLDFECKPGAEGQSELCSLTKSEPRIWDRLTHSEKETAMLANILSIDYRRWEEADEDTPEHTYSQSKLVASIDSDMGFRKVLDEHHLVVADMSPKWCTACVSKIKDVLHAARALKNEAYFVHLDTQEARGARQQYNIKCNSDCAMLWVFARNEEPQQITQGHEDVERMVRAYIAPAMSHFVDINAYNDFQAQGGVSIVAVVTGDPAFTEFGKLARGMRGGTVRFGFAFGRAGELAYNTPGATIPCLIARGPNGTEFLTGDLSASAMSDFVQTRSLPLFPALNNHMLRSALQQVTLSGGRRLPLAYYWTTLPMVDPRQLERPADWNEAQDGEWEPEPHVPVDVIELAREFRGQIYFTLGDDYIMPEFGLKSNIFPAFAIAGSADYETGRYGLPLQGEALTAQSIRQFCNDFLQQKLTPSFKSGPVPDKALTPGVVNLVVANNVHAAVSGDHDSFVQLFRPWLKTEKTVASLARVARSLKSIPTVRVLSMDTDVNFVDPTLFPNVSKSELAYFLVVQGNKPALRYKGAIGQGEILTWLKQNSPHVAQGWNLVKEQAKGIKDEEFEKARVAENAKLAALPKRDLTPDGGVAKYILKEGSGGATPSRGSIVKMHYISKLPTGEVFESSRKEDKPYEFQLGKDSVLKCWELGVASMQKGERALFSCGPAYAYGKGVKGKIVDGAVVRFDIELLSWEDPHKEL